MKLLLVALVGIFIGLLILQDIKEK